MMGEFMKILLSLSFSGACLFLPVFWAVRLCRNRLSRRWQYYIWILVALRFLVPVTFPNALAGQLFRSVELAVEGRTADKPADGNTADKVKGAEREAEAEGIGEQEDAAESIGREEEGAEDAGNEIKSAEGKMPEKEEQSVPFGILFGVFAIWMAGASGLLIHKVTVYRSYMRFLKSGNREVADLTVLNLLAEAEEALNLRRTVELYRNPMITSPIMTGFIRPAIVIPDRSMTEKELNCIFTHELIHFKYFDMFYKWLVQITICIHWFNPFAWLLGKEVNRLCELACDEKVIDALDVRERKAYGDTLLSFLKREETYKNPPAYITLTEGAEQLIERLGAIMDYRKKSKPVVILATALTMLLCFFFAGIGAYAGQPGVEPKNDVDEDILVQKEAMDYSLLYDEEANTYYILVDGATIADRPTGGVTSGSIGIVLVRKTGYAAFQFSRFSLRFDFAEKLENQCRDMVETGGISEAESELIQEAAVSIAVTEGILAEEEAGQYMDVKEIGEAAEAEEEPDDVGRKVEELKGKTYAYYQRTNYEEPYLIEYGWNLNKEDEEFYLHKEILMDDGSQIRVSFAREAEKWMEDGAAMEAVAKLLGETKQTAGSRFGLEMEQPFIVRIIYLPPEEVADFAKRSYENGNIADFSAVVGLLSEEEKETYCERSYVEDDAGFFSVIIAETEADYVTAFVERCYENEDITYFSIAVSELSETARKNLMRRALKEEKESFYYMLKNF